MPVTSLADLRKPVSREEMQRLMVEFARSAEFRAITRDQHRSWRPEVVTKLPVRPPDGYEVYYLSDAPTQRRYWHLVYDAKEPSTYKWKPFGGAGLYSHNASNSAQNTAGIGTYAAMTNSPSLTVPLAGVYAVTFNGDVWWPSAAYGEATAGVRIGSATSPVLRSWVAQSPAATGDLRRLHADGDLTLAAGDTLSMLISTSTAVNRTFGLNDGFRLRATPVRLGP